MMILVSTNLQKNELFSKVLNLSSKSKVHRQASDKIITVNLRSTKPQTGGNNG
jgi:hypothetical protein